MYSLINALLDPFLVCYLVLAAGVLRIWLQPEPIRGRRLLVVGFVCMTLICLPVTGLLAVGSLQWQIPAFDDGAVASDCIVVLGGYVAPPGDDGRPGALGTDSLYRCLTAARLYHAKSPRTVIVSGGKVDPEVAGPAVAEAMAAFLVQLGVRQANLVVEKDSRNTYENAVATAELLKERSLQSVVLVTDGGHLPRARACFARQGVEVYPHSTHPPRRFELGLGSFIPNPMAALDVQGALHEWLGFVWYRLNGRI